MQQLCKKRQHRIDFKLIYHRGSNPPFYTYVMSYIVIETHGGAEYAIIVTDRDGNNLVFDTREEAEHEASDCQVGIVIEL